MIAFWPEYCHKLLWGWYSENIGPTQTTRMEMNGLIPSYRKNMKARKATTSSHDRRSVIVEKSLWSQITPEIARIEALQDRIAHLKSEIECFQARSGSKIIMAQILESLKDMQGEAWG